MEKTVEELVAEAEERGYKRGINEQIEHEMQKPGMWEESGPTDKPEPDGFSVLGQRRRSIWDRDNEETL